MNKTNLSDERRERILTLAIEQYIKRDAEQNPEFSSAAEISEGSGNGCYIQGWMWVSFEGTDLDKNGEKIVCPYCGGRKMEEVDQWAAVSAEYPDKTSSLTEYRCGNCGHSSFLY